MRNIREEIMKKLKDTEIEHNVKIIFAIESGSRGWGFESPDSDYDCRFVYVREKNSYITVEEKKDFIEYDVDKIFDINGWDLQKFIKHIMKSNANLLEWLSSNVIYMKNEECTQLLQELGSDFFNPVSVSYHYLSMAKKKYDNILNDECKIKTYFYVLRALACVRYIYEYNQMPYMEYFNNLEKISVGNNIKGEVHKLYDLKVKVDEAYKIPENKILVEYFKSEINFFESEIKNINFEQHKDTEKCDEIFRKIIDRMWDIG